MEGEDKISSRHFFAQKNGGTKTSAAAEGYGGTSKASLHAAENKLIG